MRKAFITICLLVGVIISGCAGAQSKKNPTIVKSLPDTIPESFHFNVQDVDSRQYLANTDPDILPPNERLEILVLRELARISSEKDLPVVFDNLWDQHEEIREIVHQPGKREDFIRALAEIYYLLSSDGGPGWRGEAAQRIYTEELSRIRPRDISGYALHFYTLGLLKNGKFETAVPFLKRMEPVVSPTIYLKDLTIAMDYALENKAYSMVCRLMAGVCLKCAEHDLPVPDDKLQSAMSSLQRAGKLHLASEMLLPILNEYPGLTRYSFAALLSRDASPVFQPDRTGNPISFPKGVRIAGLRKVSKEQKVRIDVQVIKAGQGPDYIDPELEDIGKNLKRTLNFSSFYLIGKKSINLEIGEMANLRLITGDNLQITLRKSTPGQLRIEVAIKNGAKRIFHTFLDSIDGGTAIIGGPKAGDKMLLLRITTHTSKINSGRRNPLASEKYEKMNLQISTYLC